MDNEMILQKFFNFHMKMNSQTVQSFTPKFNMILVTASNQFWRRGEISLKDAFNKLVKETQKPET